MPTANSYKELEKLLRQKLTKSLQIEVAQCVREIEKEKIKEEVYDVYSPTIYERQMNHGGLIDDENIITHPVVGNILTVESRRLDGITNVGQVVETGQGYNFDFAYSGRPRPFVEKTAEELRNTNAHFTALHRGLSRQGLDVEVK
ncbi:hypothetical protein H6F38_13760 [Paenibacillus sp. EKM208P]|uniref:HK97 gp10 family phage protein n=1 Tax=Paenibacillus peoriae TaxID=59893 RepID=A0A7H0Y374_9BACL|nr:hypothetical protein [Paenibacillus peoriae]KAF6630496.1 hypothetical protein H6F38_13760 [Paenibacillus sp. EKM208P]QNR65532.1 hypothetical protein IAQ67_16755 [Paenibacillus peoriae]